MQVFSQAVCEHQEVPLADEGQLEQILAYWQQRNQQLKTGTLAATGNVCYVLSICQFSPQSHAAQGQLKEMLGLIAALGEPCVGHEIYTLKQTNAKTLLGSGTVQAVVARAQALGANMLVVDAELSPSQTRNLEHLAGMAICDREAVILNVFLKNARSQRARNQVELAQLQYLRPRIRGLGLNMDQQAGGIMGSRGPGETASELLARRLDMRLAQLNKIAQQQSRAALNQRQLRQACWRVVLVGYTNAGKTSLMNALTDAQLSAKDAPFETLDTTTRVLARVAGQEILLSDTVGFIRNLPNRLLASFESTLAEALEADLLLIVVDYADPEYALHLATTDAVLHKLGAGDIPRLYVFNKADLLAENHATPADFQPAILLSCHKPESVAQLKQAVIQQVADESIVQTVFVPYAAKQQMSLVYQLFEIISQNADEQGSHFELRGLPHQFARLTRRVA